jgi:hypothetical protein
VAAPKGEGTRIRLEVRKRNAFKKKQKKQKTVYILTTIVK